MPVIRPDEVLRDSEQPEKLSPSRYAFMAALCAATHVQLRLDGTSQGDEGSSNLSGEDLLMEAVAARRECDPAENASIESLLTSFFLFATYGNLDRQDQAWFYLSQAIAMAHTLGLHRESTYARLDPAEAEERRKVFWLLFVTERYARHWVLLFCASCVVLTWLVEHMPCSGPSRCYCEARSESRR